MLHARLYEKNVLFIVWTSPLHTFITIAIKQVTSFKLPPALVAINSGSSGSLAEVDIGYVDLFALAYVSFCN